MIRKVFLALLMFAPVAAGAQTTCTPKSQATILSTMADNAKPGTITPQVMRNFVCSTLQINIPSGQIYVGNSSGLGAAVTPTGDVTLSSAGVFTVGAIGSVTPNTGAFTTLTSPSIGNGSSAFEISGSGQWTANGAIATTMTSLGPTGAHATVQEWLTITDAAGVVRYIPAY